jgi:Sulfotransferase family
MTIDMMAESPLFVVGPPRSGTTWLQRLLLSTPGFCGGQESHFFRIFGPAVGIFDVSRTGRAVGLSNYWKEEDMVEEVRKLWLRTVSPVIRANEDSKWLVEKSPAHVLFVKEILRVLPKSRFINMMRDSRAVVASLLEASKDWGEHWAPRKISDAVRTWKESAAAGIKAKDALSQDVFHQVHYENLVRSPQAEFASVLQFIGIEIESSKLDEIILDNSFGRQKAIGGTPFARYGEQETSSNALKEPTGFFRKGSVDSWKTDLSFVQRELVWWRTKELMSRLGYDKNGLSDKEEIRPKATP